MILVGNDPHAPDSDSHRLKGLLIDYTMKEYKTLELVMGIYNGNFYKTVPELQDEVKYLLDYYERKLTFFRGKKEAVYEDIRMHNMTRSAFESCSETVRILGVLDKDLKDSKQISYFKSKAESKKVVFNNKSNTQTKLF